VTPGVHAYTFTVTASDIDDLGHASNVAYVRWLIDAALDHSRAVGWPPEAYRARGVAWVVREHHIEYLRPAFAGDALVTRTWVATMRRITSLRRYEVRRPGDGALLARASTQWVFVDVATARPARVPPEIERAYPLVPDAPALAT